ncbi:MAG: hypothetical protein Kow0089_14760 [Desulfobulbaceae bacterium]
MEQRTAQRHPTIGLMSTISDGKSSYLGVVEDISCEGVCMSQVPAVFDDTAKTCLTVVKGGTRDFRFALVPRWARATNRGMYKVIGFRIDDPPDSWREFVDRIANDSDPLHTLFAGAEDFEM